ncbi:MAG: signal peptidase I [Clostridia bacterium]|nr:signal peptidase I [Clostridia bacterium]
MKKVLQTLGSVLTTILVVFTVFIMIFTIVSFNTVGKQEATIMGYKPNIVLTDSMQGVFNVGDIVVSKVVDTATIQPGDVITFYSSDPVNYGEVITHKVKDLTQHNGELAFVTYGTTTGEEDAYPAISSDVLGKYQFRIPKLGYLFQFLKQPAGYFTIILIPFLILIGMQAFKFFKLVKQYRKEQQETLEEQRAEMESERLKAQEMMDELNRLRAQLGEQIGENAPAPVAEEPPSES